MFVKIVIKISEFEMCGVSKNQFVEEANLAVQISTLRKVLGEKRGSPRLLVTIPGKGYEFVGDVRLDRDIIVEKHRISRLTIEEGEAVTESSDRPRNTR